METEVLWNILAKPEDAKYAFTLNAQALVDQSPQSGLFRALLAANGNEENVQHAAIRFNPAVLYKLIHAPESLTTVGADQIYLFEEPLTDGETIKKPETKTQEPDNSHLFHELNITPIPHEEFAFATADDDDDAVNQDIDAAESRENFFTFDSSNESEPAQEQANDNLWQEKEPAESTYFEPVAEQPVQTEQPVAEIERSAALDPVAEAPKPQLIPLSEQTEYFHQDIDDEIYDEIVSIDDIGLEFINSYKPSEYNSDDDGANSAQHFVFEPEVSPSENGGQPTEQATQPPAQHHEEIEDIHPYVPPVIVPANEVMVVKRGVAQYDDEKLPYSFMWWLDKTRAQHSGMYSYQPYADDHKRYQQYQQQRQHHQNVNINTDTASGKDMLDELQIQYVENIYTLNAVDDLEKRVAPKNDEPITKEDKIIDRFIKSEPHIKPPTDVKLDSENKAKRSSEDGDELITETLARIYSEQMLYSKAIAAYKKLMLKYPEKSLYFAGQIEQLEKKPN